MEAFDKDAFPSVSIKGESLSARRVLPLDFDEIEKWFEERKMPRIDRNRFPRNGYIVDGIAAGFFYCTDSDMAILDGFISNPKADKTDRDVALDLIVMALIQKAEFCGYKILKCDTNLETIKKRALKWRFESVGTFECFSKGLN